MTTIENLNVVNNKERNILTFTNELTNCTIVFNTSNKMAYNMSTFSCENRGRDKGIELLYDSLKWMKMNFDKRDLPFRIELFPVPSATNNELNNREKLINYYSRLGFTVDQMSKEHGIDEMFILFDALYRNVEIIVNSNKGVGGKKRSKRRRHNNKKTCNIRKTRNFRRKKIIYKRYLKVFK